MRVFWRILQRYYAARYRRAIRTAEQSSADAARFKNQSERFFRRIKGARKQ